MTVLARKYRPATFAQVTGQMHVTAVLYRMARLGKIPPAILMAGQRGCGKTSTARILGAALHCEAGTEGLTAATWPCGACPSCLAVAAGHSLGVLEVDAASSGGVDAIRGLRQLAAYRRTIVLDEAHAMTRDGFNALLKVLEEPPAGTVFMLLTTEPGRILPTVASRCMTFTFRPIPPAAIFERLEHICAMEDIAAEHAMLEAIAGQAGGAMRDAVMLLDQVTSAGASTLEQFRQLMGISDYAVPLVEAMASGDPPAMYAALDHALARAGDPSSVTGQLVDCLTDLHILRSGGVIVAQGEPLAARQQLAARLDVPRLTAAMRVLWDWQTRIRLEDRRAGLKLACAVAAEKLCPPPRIPMAGMNGNGYREPGLDELREALGAT